MAIVHCPECNREVSDQCISCPGCGYVFRTSHKHSARKLTKQQKTFIVIAGVLLVAVVGVILLNYYGMFLSENEKYALTAAKAIQETLLMPESLQVYDAAVYAVPDDPADDSSTLKAEVLIYYGAQNKGGGISDETVVVFVSETGSTIYYEDGTTSKFDANGNAETELDSLLADLEQSWNAVSYLESEARIEQSGDPVDAEKIQKLIK